MSLDDRMRRAYREQLDDVRQRVDVTASGQRFTDERSRSGRLLAAAAALVLVGGGAALVARGFDGSTGPIVEIEAGTVDESTTITTVKPATSTTATDKTDTLLVPTPAPTSTTSTIPGGTPVTPGPVPSDATPTVESTDTPDETAATTTAQEVALASGVENSVCPSGYRAELETANLRYVGENRGWGRLFDLVDEQDGPFYYQAWEPGYPDPVTVEVTLINPVQATEIRVAQDPFTPVDGSIFIEAAGEEIDLLLEGTEGWKVHAFTEPTTLERFTIRREAVTSNIMEVLVCVAPQTG